MARSYYWTATIFEIIGSGFIALPCIKYILYDKFDALPCIIGGFFIGLAIPHSVGYHLKLKKGVDAYNKGLSLPKTTKLNFNIGQTSNGIGIALRF